MNRKLTAITSLFSLFEVTFGMSEDFLVSPLAIDHIAVTPTTAHLSMTATAMTLQLAAPAVLVNGNIIDKTPLATWSSSATSVVTVDASGKVTPVDIDTATVQATSGGKSLDFAKYPMHSA